MSSGVEGKLIAVANTGPLITAHEPEEELADLKDAMRDAKVMKDIIRKKSERRRKAYAHLQHQGMVVVD